jgi:hypothetical protein
MEPTETTQTSIIVEYIYTHNYDRNRVNSISNAIDEIKSKPNTPPHTTKILVDDEVLYFSKRHGEIERWEKEWERQKRKMSLSENTHDCPHGEDACFKNDLCIECKMDKAKERAAS